MLRVLAQLGRSGTGTSGSGGAGHIDRMWFSSSAQAQGAKRAAKPKPTRHEQIAGMKKGRHLKRIDSLQNKGRSGGGQSQLLDARMRRASEQKSKFQGAREFVQRSSATPGDQKLAEARILRQRSRQLKQRGTPGLGFTPARFRLMPIENETGTDLTALSSGQGTARRAMTVKELKEQVATSTFDNIGLHPDVAAAAKQVLEKQIRNRNPHQEDEVSLRLTEIQALGIPEILGRTRLGKRGARQAVDSLSPGPNAFLAAETGSGKTFAYALPLITMLKQEEEAVATDSWGLSMLRREQRPRALVLVPSRELVAQVTSAFKSIAHGAKVRVVGVHLGLARRDLRIKINQGPIDIMVSTPGAALQYMGRDALFKTSELRRVVVDEADSMMDEHSFGDQIRQVLNMVRRSNEKQDRREQAVFVSATLPKLIREQIIHRYPDVIHVTTPSLHRAPQRLAQTFIDVSKDFQGHKLNALGSVLRTAASDKHVIVFCNSKTHANLVYRQLYKRGIPSLLLAGANLAKKPYARTKDAAARPEISEDHAEAEESSEERSVLDDPWEKETWFAGQEEIYAAIDEAAPTEEAEVAAAPSESTVSVPISGADVNDLKAPIPAFNRKEVLSAFLGTEPIPAHLLAPIAPPEDSTVEDMISLSARRKILVCTDLGSRGLDTTCVTHVVLFDFPTTAIDYLHRAGRTARAGSRGKVTAMVSKKDRRLAEQIRLAIRQGGIIN
ncbi:hypothetical protein LPJ62_000598 [Coemansia sp. RSA 2167]|nr:hypothetical protein LPJ62_000598 [Coemansia sp. RSA 2167]